MGKLICNNYCVNIKINGGVSLYTIPNFFCSPSLTRRIRGGNAGPLRCGKGTTWEGGQRVPGIARWPGKIQPGKTTEVYV